MFVSKKKRGEASRTRITCVRCVSSAPLRAAECTDRVFDVSSSLFYASTSAHNTFAHCLTRVHRRPCFSVFLRAPSPLVGCSTKIYRNNVACDVVTESVGRILCAIRTRKSVNLCSVASGDIFVSTHPLPVSSTWRKEGRKEGVWESERGRKSLLRRVHGLPAYIRRLPGADWDLNSTDLGRFKWWVNRCVGWLAACTVCFSSGRVAPLCAAPRRPVFRCRWLARLPIRIPRIGSVLSSIIPRPMCMQFYLEIDYRVRVHNVNGAS